MEKVILISTDEFGTGSQELGQALLKTYISLLSQSEKLPRAVFLMNSGVLLTATSHETYQALKDLEDLGVEILSCKTCLEYYDHLSKLAVGEVSSMLRFIDLSNKHEVITIA